MAKKNKAGLQQATIYKIGLIVLGVIMVLFAAYVYNFYRGTLSQTTDLYAKSNRLETEKESLQQLLNRSGADLAAANQKINSLEKQLNQKPTTVYVPQQSSTPTYTKPKTTSCLPNIAGTGFTCTTY